MTDYKALLENSYNEMCGFDKTLDSHLEYLSEYIFDFTTYDGMMSVTLAAKAIEVCKAITDKTTFDYIEDRGDDYTWYLVMCNMPFFADKLEWGMSIRGAWWNYDEITINTCGLWKGGNQVEEMTFTTDEWHEFITAVIEFAGEADNGD